MGTVVTATLVVVQVIVSIALIISVLLHSGKGGGLSGLLGGGQSISGGYMVEKNLDRITIILAVIFAVTTVLLVYLLKP